MRPTRRGFLAGIGLGSLAWAIPRTSLSQIAVDPSRAKDKRSVVVSIFLRGGADGLNVVVPYAEDAYHRMRPTLRLLPPGAGTDHVFDLDGFFGINPAFADVLPLYRDGKLAIIHAAGSGDQTRSHFEAMSTMERGLAGSGTGASSGWLGRYLASTSASPSSPLRAVAFGGTLPDSLRGATEAIAVDSIEDFRLHVDDGSTRHALQRLYASGQDEMSAAGRETLQVLETLNRLNPSSYRPTNGAVYPKSDLGRALQQVALLIRAEVGLEVAVLDKGGWDTHVAQGVSGGLLSNLLLDLGASLAAFSKDLGHELSDVTVIVQTEFGRRLQENGGLGTDHGRGSVMFVLGGGVKGGRIYSRWPGLEDHQLEPPGDLRVTTDYREVLTDVLDHSLGRAPGEIFGSFSGRLGLFG